MAFIPQLFHVSFDYTALDMVLMGRARQVGLFSRLSSKDITAAMASLERFGIADLAPRPFHELSGGERQLVIFARAMVSEADILVLDEPTSALDLKNQVLILDWIKRLSYEHGMTVVLTTHHPHHSLVVADDVLLMIGESEFECGPTELVLTEKNLRAMYGVELKRIDLEHRGRTLQTIVPVIALSRSETRTAQSSRSAPAKETSI